MLGDQNPYSLKRHASNRVKPYLLFPWAAELMRHASILDLVEAVIGPDILVFHTTVWLKPPRNENYVPWRQDATYFGLAPFEHITAWVALTPSRPKSGCVRVVPGSHRKGQLAHFDDHNDALTMVSRGQKLADGIREEDAVDLVLEPGDVSLHHTLTQERQLADRHRHQLHSDPRAPYRADPAVRDSGAGHRQLQPFRPRGAAAGRTRQGRACCARRLAVALLESSIWYRRDAPHSLTVDGRPAVRGGRVALRQQPRRGKQLLAQRAGPVVVFVDAALLQDRHDQIDEVMETLGGHDAAEVEAVDIGFFDPGDQVVGDLLG